jgi:hypothetical protein
MYFFGVPDPDHNTFVHETTHVWQFQHGGPIYKTVAIDAQLTQGANAYSFAVALDKPNGSWFTMNPEMQANFVETAFFPGKFWTPQVNQTQAQDMAKAVIHGAGAPDVLDL